MPCTKVYTAHSANGTAALNGSLPVVHKLPSEDAFYSLPCKSGGDGTQNVSWL